MNAKAAMPDRPEEHCGIVGIWAHGEDVARLTYFGLYALQHRGQESAGISSTDGQRLRTVSKMGLVSQVFTEDDLVGLSGHAAIGHTRYSTTGSSRRENAQPLVVSGDLGELALGHNGNLVNAIYLRESLRERGVEPKTTTDSELIALAFATAAGNDWLERIRATVPRLQGAFCLAMLTNDGLFAIRDPWGIRPLCLGRLEKGWVIASESCALDTIGAEFVREVLPGEILAINDDGVQSQRLLFDTRRALCTFEHIYFARPDSIIDGCLVYSVRERMGVELAKEHPVDADLVMPVPDAAIPAAVGYAHQSGIPYTEGLIKNRYIGRTFIQPHQSAREDGVRLKLNPLPAVLAGKRVVVVDDSIVRGTTTPRVVALLRRAGAKAVHMRISSPPMRFPCYLGVDTAPQEQLVAHQMSIPEICEHIGADSLGYLSLGGLQRAIGLPEDLLCNACFHGNYPMPVQLELDKLALEDAIG